MLPRMPLGSSVLNPLLTFSCLESGTFFDKDGGGSIDYEEFIGGVRGAMNPRRLDLVRLAFTKVDKDASGILDAQDIVGCYDASKHPEVIAGRMTEDQVFRQFLDSLWS